MRYLVDGHNLIGQMPGIDLSDPDDELQLIEALHRWTLGHPRDKITVVFDGGSYGHPPLPKRDRIEVIFAHSPSDADARLIHRLQRLETPQGVTLVSSDRAITAVAVERRVPVKASRQFAAELDAPAKRPAGGLRARRARAEPKLSQAEVDAWLQVFGADDDNQSAQF